MSSPIDLSPQERLAVSRKAIVRHMKRHHPDAQDGLDSERSYESSSVASSGSGGLAQLKYAARMWWHRHPASALADLASPVLDGYAKAHPFKLLGISVVTGAALVVIRPWRMVSGSALLVAAVKSSGFSNTLLTMLSSLSNYSRSSDMTP